MIDFTRPEDIDLDASEKALLETFKRNEGNSLKILLSIYKGYYGKLFLSIVFCHQAFACLGSSHCNGKYHQYSNRTT